MSAPPAQTKHPLPPSHDATWHAKISHLIYQLTLDTHSPLELKAIYQRALNRVCAALDLEVGHVFEVNTAKPDYLISAPIWFFSDTAAYQGFHEATICHSFARGEGLVGQAWSLQKTVWSPSIFTTLASHISRSLPPKTAFAGVAVPIISAGKTVAVLEFFSRDPIAIPLKLRHFFEILGLQLGDAISQRQAYQRQCVLLEQLTEASKMASLGEISAAVAHEISDPLHMLSLTTETLQRTLNNESLPKLSVDDYVKRISRGLSHIKTIVSTIKSFARDSAQDPFESVNISTLAEEILALCCARLESSVIKLASKEIPPDVYIDGRGSQIAQVILNLLNNAYDAALESEEKWIRLTLVEEAEMVELAISDSGHGISPEIAQKIMSPFFTTKPSGKGTGLGLSISRTIISSHKGSLTLDTSSAKTRFVVRLPKRQVEISTN